jgi:hypothetical protein
VNCVILQPSYIPWRGYFHQIEKADVFVLLDDVQYDKRSWRNRNRIKTANGTIWLTVPVRARGSMTEVIPINRIRIDNSRPWRRKHRAALHHGYSKAPFYRRYEPLLEAFYARKDDLLADFDIEFTVALAVELGISDTRFVRSSSLDVSGAKTDRLVRILKEVGATHYITGPTARRYLDEGALHREGLSVEYMTYDYPEYEQLHPPFDPNMSILDLLMMTGPEAPRYIWDLP